MRRGVWYSRELEIMLRRVARRLRGNGSPRGAIEPAQAKDGGHGDHWGCVLRATESEELLAFVSKVIGDAEQPEVFEARGSGLAVHSSGEQLRGRVLVVNERLETAYPEALGGPIWPVTLSEGVQW